MNGTRILRAPLLLPDPEDPRLTQPVTGIDQEGREVAAAIVHERPLTLFLNGQEIVTMMTIGDRPDYLALGYLLNQNMLRPDDAVTAVEHDPELEVVVVRTAAANGFRGEAQEEGEDLGLRPGHRVRRPDGAVRPGPAAERRRASNVLALRLMRKINTMPSLYLKAGAIHGCALCEEDEVLVYMEDVGRHNAVDKIAGFMYRHGLGPRARSSTPRAG